MRTCGSAAVLPSNLAVSPDLPMPASPDSSTTPPSPPFARAQHRRIRSSSSSRPTSSTGPVRNASKRLSTTLARTASQAGTGPAIPLSPLEPRSRSSKRLPINRRVPSAITTMFGSATPCNRAARLGVSPTIPRSCASPEPVRSPTTTNPVAIPMRICSGVPDGVARFGAAATRSRPACTARSASFSRASG